MPASGRNVLQVRPTDRRFWRFTIQPIQRELAIVEPGVELAFGVVYIYCVCRLMLGTLGSSCREWQSETAISDPAFGAGNLRAGVWIIRDSATLSGLWELHERDRRAGLLLARSRHAAGPRK